MNRRSLVLVLLVAVLLVGCSGAGGPSNAEAREVVYGVYFQDARIVGKERCELTSRMEEEGHTNVWLVRYRFTDSGTEGGMILAETDSEEYPWQVFMLTVDECPAVE